MKSVTHVRIELSKLHINWKGEKSDDFHVDLNCNCNCNCNCKYDKLYSTVGGKPLLGCFTERSLSVLYLILGFTDQVQFQLFFESRKGFGFPNSCRKTVPGTWTSDLKGSIAHFSLGSWHENIRRF